MALKYLTRGGGGGSVYFFSSFYFIFQYGSTSGDKHSTRPQALSDHDYHVTIRCALRITTAVEIQCNSNTFYWLRMGRAAKELLYTVLNHHPLVCVSVPSVAWKLLVLYEANLHTHHHISMNCNNHSIIAKLKGTKNSPIKLFSTQPHDTTDPLDMGHKNAQNLVYRQLQTHFSPTIYNAC